MFIVLILIKQNVDFQLVKVVLQMMIVLILAGKINVISLRRNVRHVLVVVIVLQSKIQDVIRILLLVSLAIVIVIAHILLIQYIVLIRDVLKRRLL